jgi:Gpi18-like mannosyltransferase
LFTKGVDLEKASYVISYALILESGEKAINLPFEKREIAILAAVLGFSFLVRALLFSLQGYQNDMATYSYWFNAAAENGVRPFYTVVLRDVGWIDYPPFNVYIFWVFGSLAKALATYGVSLVNIVKLVPNLFDMAIAALIYFFVRKQLSFKLSLVASALYAFNPAVIFNAAVWGQFDAIYTFFLVLSVMLALKSKPELSAVSLAVGILTKPQAIALLPLVAFLIFKKNGVKRLLFSVAAFTATIFIVILPMEWINSNPVAFLSSIYFGAYNNYAVTSANAFNLWGMFGLWMQDGSWFVVGWALFGAFTVFTLYVLNKRWNKSSWLLVVFAAFMLFFSFFMLPTRIHERYLFPAISMLALMFPFVKKTRPFYVVITATLLANLSYILYWLNLGNPNLTGDPVVLVVSMVNLITFLYASVLMWDELKGKSWLKIDPKLGKQDKTEVKQE